MAQKNIQDTAAVVAEVAKPLSTNKTQHPFYLILMHFFLDLSTSSLVAKPQVMLKAEKFNAKEA